MADFNEADAITLNAGDVEYSAEKAAVLIDDLIGSLTGAKSEGATHVVFLSGNYRGAQYLSVSPHYDWLVDE